MGQEHNYTMLQKTSPKILAYIDKCPGCTAQERLKLLLLEVYLMEQILAVVQWRFNTFSTFSHDSSTKVYILSYDVRHVTGKFLKS